MILFTKRVSRVKPRRRHMVTHPFPAPPFPVVTSRNPGNAQGFIGAPRPQDATHPDIALPQSANLDVPGPIATTPRNVAAITGVLPQFIPPTNASLSSSIVGSLIPHNFNPSSVDILASTAKLPMGGSAFPSFPLPDQRETGIPLTETSSTLRIVNLTDQDTIRSPSPSSAPNFTPFQLSRPGSGLSPVVVDPESSRDSLLLSKAPHAAPSPASALCPMGDRNYVSGLPMHPSPLSITDQQSTLSQEPLLQPRLQDTLILLPSPPSKAGAHGAFNLAQPMQAISHQTPISSVGAFLASRRAEKTAFNTPFPPRPPPVAFPDPSRFVNVPVPTHIPSAIPLSFDANPYPHSIAPSSLRARRAVSLPTSPAHVRQNLLLVSSHPILIFLSRVSPTWIRLEGRPRRVCI
jgi:hypothetical protein